MSPFTKPAWAVGSVRILTLACGLFNSKWFSSRAFGAWIEIKAYLNGNPGRRGASIDVTGLSRIAPGSYAEGDLAFARAGPVAPAQLSSTPSAPTAHDAVHFMLTRASIEHAQDRNELLQTTIKFGDKKKCLVCSRNTLGKF